MRPFQLAVALLTPVMAAFVLLLMSVDNPFSIAFSALLITAQVPMIRWILEFDARHAARVKSRS